MVLTTHNPLDADRCDKIAVLANGGYLAFFGTPAAARDYFGADSLDEIYERLAGLGDPVKAWSRRFFPFSRTNSAVSPTLAFSSQPGPTMLFPDVAGRLSAGPVGLDGPAEPQALGASVAFPVRDARRAPRQWAVLTKRNADILARSRRTLAILVGSPVAVLLMFRLGARAGLGVTAFGRLAVAPRRAAARLYGTTFDRAVGVDWLILAGFTVAFFAATFAVVIRRTRSH